MSSEFDAAPWSISEQIVEDPASGLTVQFEVVEGSSAKYRLRIFGESLPFGNRELLFGDDGKYAGGGTAAAGACRPTWLQRLDA